MTGTDPLTDGALSRTDDYHYYPWDQFHNFQWPGTVPLVENPYDLQAFNLPQSTDPDGFYHGVPVPEYYDQSASYDTSAAVSQFPSPGDISKPFTESSSTSLASLELDAAGPSTRASRRPPLKKSATSSNDHPRHDSYAKRRKSAPKPSTNASTHVSPDNDAASNDHEPRESHKRVQERNRLAANRFRLRKRADALRLKDEEWVMEQQNRALSTDVEGLTAEVYQLKMQLLRHSDCDCKLIQDYIRNEAHKYIHDLDSLPRHGS